MTTSKEYLGQVIDAFRAGNHDDANTAFSGAVNSITQRVLQIEPEAEVQPEVEPVETDME